MSDIPEEDETISRMSQAVTEAQIIDTMADVFEEDDTIGQMPPAVAEEISVETLGAGADEWLDVSQPSVSENILENADAEGIPSDLDRNYQVPATLTMFLPPQTPGDSQDVTQDILTEDGAALEGEAALSAAADSHSVTAASGERRVLGGTEGASTKSPGQTVPPVTPPVRDVQDIQDLRSQEGAGSVRRRQWTSSGKPSPRPALAVPAEEGDWGGVTLNKCLLVALLLVGVGFGIFGPATHRRPDQDPEQLAADSELLDKRAADENQHRAADVRPGSSLWTDPTLEKPGGTPHSFGSLEVPVDNKSDHIQAKLESCLQTVFHLDGQEQSESRAQTAKLNPLEGRRLVKAAEGPEGREEEVGRRDRGKRRWQEEERVRQQDGKEEGRKRWDRDMGGWQKVTGKQGRNQPDGRDGHRQEKEGGHQRVEEEGGRLWQDGDKGSRQWYKEDRGADKRPAKEAGTEQRGKAEGGRRWGGKEGRRGVEEGDRRWGGKEGRRGVEEGDRRWGGKEGRRGVEEGDRRWGGKEGRRGVEEGDRRWGGKEGRRGVEEGDRRWGGKEGRRGVEEGDRRWGGKEGRRGVEEGDRRWGGKDDRRGVEEGDRRWGGKEGRRGVEGDRQGDKERERWWDKKDKWQGDEQGRQRVNEGRRGEEGGKFHGAKVSRQGDWKGDRWWGKKDGRRGDEKGGKRQEDKGWRRRRGDEEEGSKWGKERDRRQHGDQPACGDVPSCAQREGQELFGLDLPPVTEPQLASAVADYIRQSGLSPALAQQLTARAASFFPGGVFAHHQESLAAFLDRLEEEVEEAAEREFGDDEAVTDFEDYVWARLVGEEAIRDRNARKQKAADHHHRQQGDRRAPGDSHKREREGKWSPRVREVGR
ncbi:pre-B-cell leukemia transcription factor-interacting protein 1-like [Hypanus sabinus]|uniref:pre-B-cell leukemia transcription factor-interacting protein 1-like n=1 Tax=Hypanus sabinus TaxID=79690 RepID=UPI0028C39444|nr:pre-B-cell leukemia transcription factor-interacting protein 1-like [Hypanus sabinus]